jgi:predicted DNA-binding ArsR family transcriptional regulator
MAGRNADGGWQPPESGGAPRPSQAVILLVVAILLLSTLDGIFTLILIETGAVREWNPFLARLIEHDVQVFANVKSALTSAGVFVLAVFVDRSLFQRIPVRRVLELIFVGYCLLVLYHLSLLVQVFVV